jgi:CBS domain containing-hemolysin-like protein
VGITLASLGLGWQGEPYVAGLLLPVFKLLFSSGGEASTWAHAAAFGLALLFITFIQVLVGELIPKSVALQFPDRVALFVVRPMRFFTLICWPLGWLLMSAAAKLMKLAGIKPADARSLAVSEEELLLLLSESEKAGVVSREEQRMVQRVFKFYDKVTREIMAPRPDIAGLELHATENEIQRAFEQGYSRLPVYDGNLDNIKGVVYVKDLIYTLQDPKLIKLVDLLRETLFVPETMPVATLLKDFQKNKMHMAIVVDEFGDTAGLVTLEDAIEEIVGEIQDEYDHEPAEVQRAPDGALVSEGKTSLDHLKDILPDFEPPEGSFKTVAGLVFHLAGRVPREGESLTYGGLSFTILKREGRRLRKIAIRRQPSSRAGAPGGGGASNGALPSPTPSARVEIPDMVPESAGGEAQQETPRDGTHVPDEEREMRGSEDGTAPQRTSRRSARHLRPPQVASDDTKQ